MTFGLHFFVFFDFFVFFAGHLQHPHFFRFGAAFVRCRKITRPMEPALDELCAKAHGSGSGSGSAYTFKSKTG